MNGLIVAGGSALNSKELKKQCNYSDIVVAADRGIESLLKADCRVDYLIGDFDSIKQEVLLEVEKTKIEIIKHPIAKDKTDTELAVDLLLDLGCKSIILVGVTGTRLDHTMANISILRNLYFKGIISKIIDDNNIIEYLGKKVNIYKAKSRYISILPISLEGVVVSLEGFFFPITKKNISYGSSLGVSNYLVKDKGEIVKHSGEALVFQSRD
ncbi:MAG: thiamine diphosphokinase [Gudongella sp.]|nr:thiamine diphosphokinase [Gudongella sp.]